MELPQWALTIGTWEQYPAVLLMVEASAGRIIMIKSYLLHTVSLYKSVYFVRSDLTTEIGKQEKKMEYSYTVQLQESRIEFSVLRKNTKKATDIEGKKSGYITHFLLPEWRFIKRNPRQAKIYRRDLHENGPKWKFCLIEKFLQCVKKFLYETEFSFRSVFMEILLLNFCLSTIALYKLLRQ